MAYLRKIIITDGTDDADVNSEGRLDVVQHAHPDSGRINFVYNGLSTTEDFIIIDISDTTNYPHTETGYVHLEDLSIQVDTDANGDYELSIGFLEDVDGTNGDYYELWSVSGTKKTSQNKTEFYPFYPNGQRCEKEFIATGVKSLNDTGFQTDVNLNTTLSGGTADTPSGTGDLVLRFTGNAGTVNLNINLAYHTHA